MNILICDDMQNEIEKLINLLGGSGYDVSTVGFYSGVDALNYVRSGKAIDVCFLDIVMPEMSGVELAKELRREGFGGKIIFLTASNSYAHESYRVDAFDYLLKPPAPGAVREVLGRLEHALKSADTDGVTVVTRSVTSFLPFSNIEYVEVINHKVYYRLTDGGNVEANATFAETVPQLLRDGRFAQCHNSYIVNMNAVRTLTGREVTMQSGAKAPISRTYAEMKKKYLDWRLGGEGK